MPNKHAAIKDLRKNKRRAARNAQVKTNIKALFKKASAFVREGNKSEAKDAIAKYQQAADKAIKTGVLNKNTAARKKSSLMKKIVA
ncbi:30S ribosomal protein S20 [Candidatus Uhrbacteria bacterium]|nr:30S ribosomal protein S20 [Candidatus Uhrbacteria bacterium]